MSSISSVDKTTFAIRRSVPSDIPRSDFEKITLEDVKQFYRTQYSQSNLFVGIAGGFQPQFLDTMKKDFRSLPVGAGFHPRFKPPEGISSNPGAVDSRTVTGELAETVEGFLGLPRDTRT